MGHVSHSNANTPHAIRKEIQEAPNNTVISYASSKLLGLSILTFKKCREQESTLREFTPIRKSMTGRSYLCGY